MPATYFFMTSLHNSLNERMFSSQTLKSSLHLYGHTPSVSLKSNNLELLMGYGHDVLSS